MGWLEILFGFLSEKAQVVIPKGIFQSLVVDGIIGGLGGVLSFVPLIILLFLFISFLEDTGYMARAAFIMDKFLHIFGLHGQSFLPMMVGFGCSVPAIMAARTLKNNRDRIITILVTPFMSCGAKLPVHILLAAAFFPKNAANVVMIIYAIGVTLALLSSLLFRKTVLKGDSTPFVMELPPYRMPTLKGIGFHVWDKTWMYLKKAGTVLFAASILSWAILTFPQLKFDEEKYSKIASDYEMSINRNEIKAEINDIVSGKTDLSLIEDEEEKNEKQSMKDAILKGDLTVEDKVMEIVKTDVESYIATLQAEERLSHSIAGYIGKAIEPAIKPLGFDWKIGISAITGFAAKEIVVSTLGILYKVGTEESEESESLRDALRNDETFNPLIAFSLMLLTLIVAPCFAALATIKAEAGWKWLGFNVLYTTVLAWVLCFAVFQIGRLFGLV
jgi:ferrous iron transport protein B